jgi:hypothetical protein
VTEDCWCNGLALCLSSSGSITNGMFGGSLFSTTFDVCIFRKTSAMFKHRCHGAICHQLFVPRWNVSTGVTVLFVICYLYLGGMFKHWCHGAICHQLFVLSIMLICYSPGYKYFN